MFLNRVASCLNFFIEIHICGIYTTYNMPKVKNEILPYEYKNIICFMQIFLPVQLRKFPKI